MKLEQFPEDIRPHLIPEPGGDMYYQCLGCGSEFDIERLLYTCPECGGVLLLNDRNSPSHFQGRGHLWRRIFDYRRMLNYQPLKGIFRYYEFIAPVIPLDRIVFLGEAHTPLVGANKRMRAELGVDFFFKNDGLNPSASFKDRGMACALSYINDLAKRKNLTSLLAICASTGDTSASAALYASYLEHFLKSVVLLPKGKVTPQQLSQPLGAGAKVLEIPGVFDDCMKVVEFLSENYPVALLNSKNSWRILGQESFSFEVAQDFDYALADKALVVPIGNAGNISAIMSGFLKFLKAGVISHLPKIIGVQSEHADPVYRYYLEENSLKREFVPVNVRPSVAQAAMIGNPVSMPRVIKLTDEYNQAGGSKKVFVVQVSEQEIMDAMITANRNGNIACTQGGESLAGFRKAIQSGIVSPGDIGVLDSTAHVLKFTDFQNMYFTDGFDSTFEVEPRPELKAAPMEVKPSGSSTRNENMHASVEDIAHEIAAILGLEKGSGKS